MKTELNIVAQPLPETFAQAMAIATKREEQLCDLIGKCYDRTETYPQAIVDITEEVNNINELVYAVFHLGAYAGNEQARQELRNMLDE